MLKYRVSTLPQGSIMLQNEMKLVLKYRKPKGLWVRKAHHDNVELANL